MNCFFCKGRLENKTAAFMTEMERSIIVIRNVPAQVCHQCGEVSYDDESARKIEKIINSMKPHTEIAIVNYSDQAA